MSKICSLLRVLNDIMMAVDKKKHVFLVLLDLSAAFDTVDHEILLHFLKEHLGCLDQCFTCLKHISKSVHSAYPVTMFFPLLHSLFLVLHRYQFWGPSFSVCTLFLSVLYYGPTNLCTIYCCRQNQGHLMLRLLFRSTCNTHVKRSFRNSSYNT